MGKTAEGCQADLAAPTPFATARAIGRALQAAGSEIGAQAEDRAAVQARLRFAMQAQAAAGTNQAWPELARKGVRSGRARLNLMPPSGDLSRHPIISRALYEMVLDEEHARALTAAAKDPELYAEVADAFEHGPLEVLLTPEVSSTPVTVIGTLAAYAGAARS